MAKEKNIKTKYEIIQVASRLFLEKGYTKTSPNAIARELQISPGNVTYYYPTKEHILLVIVKMLCDFQWKLFQTEASQGMESISSICLEFMTVASACQENPKAKDFFTSVYQSEMCRDYLRNNHIERVKRVFQYHCSEWTEERFIMTELMVMGLYFSVFTADDRIIPLKIRIEAGLHMILRLYDIEEEARNSEIERVLHIDYRRIGKKVYRAFVNYVENIDEHILEDIIKN